MRLHLLFCLLTACGDSAARSDAGLDPDAPLMTGPSGCPRTAAPEDRARHVVVSHPYDSTGAQAGTYEVLDLSAAGSLTRPDARRTFVMGRATSGTIAFTPDGEIGLVATERGKLGVFRLAGGMPTVVHEAFEGSFYASRVVVESRGDRALIIDGNWRENGGGIYLVTIGCDGTLTDHGRIAISKLPGGLAFDGQRAIIAAADVLDSTDPNDDVFLLGWGAEPAMIDGVDAFDGNSAIVGGTALTSDGSVFLVGDISQFSDVPNRIGVVGVGPDRLRSLGTLMVEDPAAIATSPFGAVAVVASAFGDAIFVLDANGPNGAWQVRGEVAYQGASPQLPSDLATIDRGALRGHVLVSENVSIRQLAFRAAGGVDDLGSLPFGSGYEHITGAIGVTP